MSFARIEVLEYCKINMLAPHPLGPPFPPFLLLSNIHCLAFTCTQLEPVQALQPPFRLVVPEEAVMNRATVQCAVVGAGCGLGLHLFTSRSVTHNTEFQLQAILKARNAVRPQPLVWLLSAF